MRSREITTPYLMDRDVCVVENVDQVDWEFKYDRRKYKVEVGKEGLVPFPALVNALGDLRFCAQRADALSHRRTARTGIVSHAPRVDPHALLGATRRWRTRTSRTSSDFAFSPG